MKIKSQKDFLSGLMFLVVGGIFAWGATSYSIGTGARMGPGYFPLLLGVLLAVLGAIVAEWLAASSGLGYLVLSGSFNFNTARSFAAILALAIIGTSFFALMSFLEQRISWRSVQIHSH